MEQFVKGDIVVVPFPFSDLSSSKKRPAYVAANLFGDDLILCQITSKLLKDKYAIEVTESHFEFGSLYQVSNIRPSRIFTADKGIIQYKIGHLKADKINEISERIHEVFS